jgi:type II secretion system protein I
MRAEEILRLNKGQSLIEILVALGIASLVLLGIVKASTVSVKNANYSQDQTMATSLAQKKMAEIIRLKNSDPASFFVSGQTSAQEQIENYCRKTIVNSDGSTATILIDVYWGEEGDGSDCDLKKYLYKYHLESNVTDQE